MVLLGFAAAQVLRRLERRRSKNENVDLRAHCNTLGSDEKREAEAEAPASCAGREDEPAGKSDRPFLARVPVKRVVSAGCLPLSKLCD